MCHKNKVKLTFSFLFSFLLITACNKQGDSVVVDTEPVLGCDGQTYPQPSQSPYVLPYAVGQTFQTGLSNCSSSFHGAGQPDQYAYDFDMPLGTPFVAARSGRVYEIVENATGGGGTNSGPSKTAIVGNYITIDHEDGTFGLYLHSPDNGIDVAVNDRVEQGDVLGVTGRSGLAGYPHLHFIVVKSPPVWPYKGVAISFGNASPPDVVLKSYTEYKAENY